MTADATGAMLWAACRVLGHSGAPCARCGCSCSAGAACPSCSAAMAAMQLVSLDGDSPDGLDRTAPAPAARQLERSAPPPASNGRGPMRTYLLIDEPGHTWEIKTDRPSPEQARCPLIIAAGGTCGLPGNLSIDEMGKCRRCACVLGVSEQIATFSGCESSCGCHAPEVVAAVQRPA